MITSLPFRRISTLLLVVSFYINTASAGIETIPNGSFIINMGVVPQTYANGLKPWGLVWNLIHSYKVPVKWVIGQSKIKDGADFTYNSVDYKGGTFIILKKYRNQKVDSMITSWQSQGVVGITTNSGFAVDVTYTLKYNPLWTFDAQNGKIAQNYLTEAGIPLTSYPIKDPSALNGCDDLFVMPHADPTWGTHQSLLFWNKNNRGWLWYGCHAGSVIEGTMNPADTNQQMNFLSTKGLVNFSDHGNPTAPFNYRFPSDPEMQFMGTMDAAVNNGSEQVYLPLPGGTWRSSTHVAVYDPSDPDVPALSPGEAAIVAYGRAFGDSTLGKVMFQAGHNFDKGNAAAVSAIRAFFNFSYLSVLDKIVTPDINAPLGLTGNGGSNYPFSAGLPPGHEASDYTFHWTASVNGTFSNEFGQSTTFKPAGVAATSACTIMVTITDGCGREYYQTVDFTVQPQAPVALDRTAKTILNSPGTGAQPIGKTMPLAGTDVDGYVSSYILKSLPATGLLYYDNDNNASTPDISITNIPAGGLVLTAAQMKSLKYDAPDGFGGSVNMQYTVQDNTSLYSANTATYTIPTNPPPVTQNFVCKPVVSNADYTAVCPLFATDNNSIVSYRIVSLPAVSKCTVYLYKVQVSEGDVLTPAQASQLVFKPSGNYIGYAEILYTATDNDGADDETPSTITLQMVNQAPVAQDISANVINNPVGAVMIGIPALSATDNDGTVASYLVTNAPASTQGVLYYNNNGAYTPVSDKQVLTLSQASSLKFDPVDTYKGVARFKYAATDDGNLTSTVPAVFSIPVKSVTPVANNISNNAIYSGADQTQIKPLVAHDNDSTDIITAYIIKELPAPFAGTLYQLSSGNYVPSQAGQEMTAAQAGTLKFKPVKGFTGNATFTYTAKDDEGLVDPTAATVTIPVTNNAPVAANVTSTKINDTVNIVTIKPLAATDADGIIAKYIITSLPASTTGILKLDGAGITPGQEISVADASRLQFSPVLHNNKDASFKYTAIDDLGMADASDATFTVPINLIQYRKPPKADSKTTNKINLRSNRNIMPLSGSDSDGVVTTFVITKLKTNEGTLSVQGVPVTLNQEISADAADKLTFTPAANFTGSTSFSYVAVDNDDQNSAEAVFNIPVENTKPVALNYTASQVKTNTTTVVAGLSATDDDGTIASYKITSLPASGTLQFDSTSTGVWKNVIFGKTLTPAQASRLRIISGGTAGYANFTFNAKDNVGDTSTSATYSIPVATVADDQDPIPYNVTMSPIAMNAGQTLITPLSAVDPDGSILAYVLQTIPPSYHGTIMYDSSGYWAVMRGVLTISPLQAATLKFQPSGIYIGDVTFTFKAIDITGHYSVNEATYTIPVVNAINTNNITNASLTGNSGASTLSALSATGLITKYIITELPAKGTGKLILDGSAITVNQEIPVASGSRLEFDPDASFKGNATFKYTAADNAGNTDLTPAVFTIPVTDQAPVADNKASQVITNFIGTTAQAIPALTATDYDGTIANYYIKTLPANGKLYKNGTLISSIPAGGFSITTAQAAQLSFDPDDNFGGATGFTYTAKDNTGNLSAAATYQILVNTPPVSNNQTVPPMYASQPRANIAALTGSDDGSVAYYSVLTLPSSSDGTLFLNNVPVTDLSQVDTLTAAQAAQLSFMPGTFFDGTIFTYTVTDNTGLIDVTPAVYDIPLSGMGTLNPLPLELLSFSGYKSASDNILYWSMSQEVNSDHYEVERSLNGTSYTSIGTVGAAGNSSAKSNYSFNDRNVSSGNYYYRIKLVDTDGDYKYSKTISIKRSGNIVPVTKVLSNPFRDKLVVELVVVNEGKTTFSLFDLKGHLVKKMEIMTSKGTNHIELEGLANLSSAIYMLQVSNGDGKFNTELLKSN